jgi:hypothetical protein
MHKKFSALWYLPSPLVVGHTEFYGSLSFLPVWCRVQALLWPVRGTKKKHPCWFGVVCSWLAATPGTHAKKVSAP